MVRGCLRLPIVISPTICPTVHHLSLLTVSIVIWRRRPKAILVLVSVLTFVLHPHLLLRVGVGIVLSVLRMMRVV